MYQKKYYFVLKHLVKLVSFDINYVSFIMYAEIALPIRIHPLTYKIPENAPDDLIGRLVRVSLKNKIYYGLILNVKKELSQLNYNNTKPIKIKPIDNIYQHFTTEKGVKFFDWLADYYLNPVGIAIKSGFFREIANLLEKLNLDISQNQRIIKSPDIDTTESVSFENYQSVSSCIKDKKYKTFLCHSKSAEEELLFVAQLLKTLSNQIQGAIILIPEIHQIKKVKDSLEPIVGERLCEFYGNLSKKKKMSSLYKILSGQCDIVIGARSAVLAPLKNISLFIIMSEHSRSYKSDEGLRYNARDVAVMRGYIENSCVVLTSYSPSVESFYNLKSCKYSALNINVLNLPNRPKIKIINKKVNRLKDFSISNEVLTAAKKALLQKENFLFIVSQQGYSFIKCLDCKEVARCNKCKSALVFYKSEGVVKCLYCGQVANPIVNCLECKGFRMEFSGIGAEKLKEEIYNSLSTNSIVIEKEKTTPDLSEGLQPFVIGTPSAIKNTRGLKFHSAAILNTDYMFLRPNFRVYERTFQEIIKISQLVKEDGIMFLETNNPQNIVLKFIKNYDFEGFYNYELSQRESLNYPPYAKIVFLNIYLKNKDNNILDSINKVIEKNSGSGIEVLQNFENVSILKSHRYCLRLRLKSIHRKALNISAQRFLKEIEGIKDVIVKVDVDPLNI